MSDPMTNLQIEDVLTSIRRLVAEGDKSRAADKPVSGASKQAPTAANSPDRLVLTPALRVGDDAKAEIDDAPEDRVSGDAAVQAASDTSPVEATALAATAAETVFSEADTSSAVEIVFEDEPDDLSDYAVTEIEPVEESAPEAETDTPQPEATVADITAPEPSFRHFDRDALMRDNRPLHSVSDHVVEEPAVDETEDFGDDLAVDTAPDPQVDEKLNAFLSDDAMLADAGLDEETLRELVKDVIRQELQGVMGERITRNVRKLVRREIHRILAAQDFD
ncbi:hypothetical protein [Yoonia sp. 208BN28-4]|uniref:hypothetical protein n=1 Tax=Yoonia sp. 208BN28-4 TaxID=3126505 RepID=UPI0030975640